MKAALFAVLAALALAQSGPALQPARISGVVVRTDGETPIPGARVVLARTSSTPGEDYATISGSDGRFTLQNIVPGRYVLRATLRGFLDGAYGARRPKRPGAELDISAGQALGNLTIQMTAGAVISGRAYDDSGRLLPDVTIQAIQPRYDPDGRRIASMVLSTRTNDIGEYRLYWISPGTYYIAATAPEMYPSNPSDPKRPVNEQYSGRQYVFRPTFYPNVLDEAQAMPLTVQAGVELRGIDVLLTRQPTVRVSGRIVDEAGGTSTGRSDVSLTTSRTNWVNLASMSSVATTAKGEFTFRAVAAGSYILFADGQTSPHRYGELEIQVGDRDVSDLTVRVEPALPTKLMGQAEFESGRPLERANLSFTSVDPSRPARFATMINAAKFEVTLVEPTTYRLTLNSAEDGYFLRWARSGMRDILRDGLDTRAGATEPLEIMIGTTNSVVEGTVSDEGARPAVGVQVVLVPSDRRLRKDLFRTATTDQAGRYNFRGVAPGDYKLFAWEDIEPFGYFDPVFLEKHETAGTPVHVEQNQSVSTNLRVIP